MLVGMEKDGMIQSLIMEPCQHPDLHSKLPNLLAAFSEVWRKKKAKEWEVKDGLGVYSEETCYKFHQLLVTTLLAYGNALGSLCGVMRKLTLVTNDAWAEMEEGTNSGKSKMRGWGKGKGETDKGRVKSGRQKMLQGV